MKFIVIEDAPEVVESIKLCISIRWPTSTVVATPKGREGIRLIQRDTPDIVILDLALSDGYGFDFLRELREFSVVPVLIVSAEADEVSRVKGLELGADDYIVKPFSHTELLARIQAILRRVRMAEMSSDDVVIKDGRLSIDLAAGRVALDGREVELSATEWRLFSYLVRNSGRVIPIEVLASNVWGLKYVESSTIKMFIRRLRLKLGDNTQSPTIILSHRGRGYSLELSDRMNHRAPNVRAGRTK
jgi:two-component system, OmpR family, KDP operon response regulator KdpE